MKINKIVALAILACASLTSCLKSEYSVSGFVWFAEVVDETHLRADGDIIYNIVENGTDSKFINCSRLIINCDLQTAVIDGKQDIKLNAYSEIKVKDCVLSDDESVGGFGRDSVYIEPNGRIWTGNGENQYMTLYVDVPKIKDSETVHDLELVFDKTSDADEIRFILYHDAHGDVITNETPDDKKSSDRFYISFKVKDCLSSIKLTNSTRFTFTTAFDKEKEESEKTEDSIDGSSQEG